MQIHQIRNATVKITYAGKTFLVDPWLLPKDAMPGFEGAFHSEVRQPRVELPLPVAEIVKADAVILTHVHPDHWDEMAANHIQKKIPFFVQSPTDKTIIEKYGFTNVCILSESGTLFEGITLYKTPCQHGRKEIVKPMCEKMGMPYDAMGIVFKNSAEKTLYVAGDTIWCEEVKHTLDTYKPQVVLINACGASLLVGNGERLIMHKQDIEDLSSYIPQAQIIASHMDTVSHLTVTRQDIRSLGLPNVHVPEDNEVLSF